MIFISAGDVVPPLSLVVPSLGTTNDVSSTTTAAAALCIARAAAVTTESYPDGLVLNDREPHTVGPPRSIIL